MFFSLDYFDGFGFLEITCLCTIFCQQSQARYIRSLFQEQYFAPFAARSLLPLHPARSRMRALYPVLLPVCSAGFVMATLFLFLWSKGKWWGVRASDCIVTTWYGIFHTFIFRGIVEVQRLEMNFYLFCDHRSSGRDRFTSWVIPPPGVGFITNRFSG